MKRLFIHCWVVILALITGCSVSTPFKWVNGELQKKTIGAIENDQVLVAITHANIDPDKRDLFNAGAYRVLDSLPSQPGLLGYSVRRQLFGDEVWTATVWLDEESMLRFVQSPAHVQAVRESRSAVRNIQYTRLLIKRSDLPLSWDVLLKSSDPQHKETKLDSK
ncbi:antibiotic biosynthesis monooxygenase family protein [Undibacterium sp. RTI2.1]|uniref:antibiotic biosynthesis monooxygenase family protein n=1 Tax=unclassified Undibacterium TaxID=2630295 RepID=UPI002B23C71B|nr:MULTISPECIES: antibiotic biosynthesis monooxygenase family protein [unclassified Undibacterium]MEB0031430.1 antibiotic biosynthesis monooxygenase family protein [Undibacterium sp. RTI2.1]MEB0117738.1 antibiotic biosynthesis monooxygenase family protein [Undibacterium sp. RTI2.2]